VASGKANGAAFGDARASHADISRAKKLLGYEPRYSVATGLPMTIEHFRRVQGD